MKLIITLLNSNLARRISAKLVARLAGIVFTHRERGIGVLGYPIPPHPLPPRPPEPEPEPEPEPAGRYLSPPHTQHTQQAQQTIQSSRTQEPRTKTQEPRTKNQEPRTKKRETRTRTRARARNTTYSLYSTLHYPTTPCPTKEKNQTDGDVVLNPRA